MNSSCPNSDQLERFVIGVCELDENRDIAGHITACSNCRQWVADAQTDEALLPGIRRLIGGLDWGAECHQGDGGGGEPADKVIPTSIPGYDIVSLLGEGGMGTVYEAHQKSPDRRVALKVIRAGAMSKNAVHRFKRETDMLGRLNHRGIAQIYEAGTAHEGSRSVPYFAMEFVSGLRLTEFAKERGFGVRERVELLARVCDAVDHAHRNNVVHRDLKPSNVLVSESGQPKILDFGIARATDSDIQLQTLQTDAGQLVGTISYMSPEQVAGNPSRIDKRTDVYSLGVIAYELLVGRSPHNLRGKIVPEAARIIKEDDPSLLGSIDRSLRGDIEAIVCQAMEKNPDRRYQSAEAFAADLTCFLNDEPILARPPGTLYQIRKFSRRHKMFVGGLAIAFLGLSCGLIVATLEAAKAGRQRDRAVEAELAAQNAAARARIQTLQAERTLDFLREMLGSASPMMAPHDLTVRELLERASVRAGAELADEPAIESAVRTAIGSAYIGIGMYEAAVGQLQVALRLQRDLYGDIHEDTVGTVLNLAYAYGLRGQFETSENLLSELLTALDGVEDEKHNRIAAAYDQLAEVLREKGDLEAAIKARATALKVCLQGHQAAGTECTLLKRSLGELHHALGEYDEALRLYDEALAEQQAFLGEDHADLSWTLHCRATLLHERGGLVSAEVAYRETTEFQRRVLGDEHVELAINMSMLSALLVQKHEYIEAEKLLVDSLAMRRSLLGDEHVHIAMHLFNMGGFYQQLGLLEKAETFLQDALAMRRKLHGPSHPMTVQATQSLASLLFDRGRFAQAEELLLEVIDARLMLCSEQDFAVLSARSDLARVWIQQGHLAEAEMILLDVLAAHRHDPDEWPGGLAVTLERLANLELHRSGYAAAWEYAHEAVSIRRAAGSIDGQHLARALETSGSILLAQVSAEEAEPYLTEAAEIRAKALPKEHWETAYGQVLLAVCRMKFQPDDEAATLLLAGSEVLRAVLGEQHPKTVFALHQLAKPN